MVVYSRQTLRPQNTGNNKPRLCILYLRNKCPYFYRTFNRWCTIMSGTWKYDDPRLKMSHEGVPCPTNYCVSYVLSYDKKTTQNVKKQRRIYLTFAFCFTVTQGDIIVSPRVTVKWWTYDDAQRHVTHFDQLAKQLIVGHTTMSFSVCFVFRRRPT